MSPARYAVSSFTYAERPSSLIPNLLRAQHNSCQRNLTQCSTAFQLKVSGNKKAVQKNGFLALLVAHPLQTAISWVLATPGSRANCLTNQAAATAKAFTLVDKRLLSRAALFL